MAIGTSFARLQRCYVGNGAENRRRCTSGNGQVPSRAIGHSLRFHYWGMNGDELATAHSGNSRTHKGPSRPDKGGHLQSGMPLSSINDKCDTISRGQCMWLLMTCYINIRSTRLSFGEGPTTFQEHGLEHATAFPCEGRRQKYCEPCEEQVRGREGKQKGGINWCESRSVCRPLNAEEGNENAPTPTPAC